MRNQVKSQHTVDLKACIAYDAITNSSGRAGGSFRGERTYKPKKEFAYRIIECTQGGQPARCPIPNFCVRRSVWWCFGGGQFCFPWWRCDVLWCDVDWRGMMSCGWFQGDVRTGNVVGCGMSCYDVLRCDVCISAWQVVWCKEMGWNGMGRDVMDWCVELGDVLWTTQGPCHSKTLEMSSPMRGATLGCKTQKDYVLQCSTPVLLRATKYYYVLL